jgi:hypothetical protein
MEVAVAVTGLYGFEAAAVEPYGKSCTRPDDSEVAAWRVRYLDGSTRVVATKADVHGEVDWFEPLFPRPTIQAECGRPESDKRQYESLYAPATDEEISIALEAYHKWYEYNRDRAQMKIALDEILTRRRLAQWALPPRPDDCTRIRVLVWVCCKCDSGRVRVFADYGWSDTMLLWEGQTRNADDSALSDERNLAEFFYNGPGGRASLSIVDGGEPSPET